MDRMENTASINIRIVVGVSTDPLLKNGLHNPVASCMLRALPSNGRFLQNHCLVTGLYATLLLSYLI
jgi:hypothetical protein